MLVLFEGESGPSDTLRFIEEKGGAGLWSWDIKAKKMDWSPGFYALLGLDPGTVEPSYPEIYALTHPEDRRPPPGRSSMYSIRPFRSTVHSASSGRMDACAGF